MNKKKVCKQNTNIKNKKACMFVEQKQTNIKDVEVIQQGNKLVVTFSDIGLDLENTSRYGQIINEKMRERSIIALLKVIYELQPTYESEITEVSGLSRAHAKTLINEVEARGLLKLAAHTDPLLKEKKDCLRLARVPYSRVRWYTVRDEIVKTVEKLPLSDSLNMNVQNRQDFIEMWKKEVKDRTKEEINMKRNKALEKMDDVTLIEKIIRDEAKYLEGRSANTDVIRKMVFKKKRKYVGDKKAHFIMEMLQEDGYIKRNFGGGHVFVNPEKIRKKDEEIIDTILKEHKDAPHYVESLEEK